MLVVRKLRVSYARLLVSPLGERIGNNRVIDLMRFGSDGLMRGFLITALSPLPASRMNLSSFPTWLIICLPPPKKLLWDFQCLKKVWAVFHLDNVVLDLSFSAKYELPCCCSLTVLSVTIVRGWYDFVDYVPILCSPLNFFRTLQI